jgi:hypothetical protein
LHKTTAPTSTCRCCSGVLTKESDKNDPVDDAATVSADLDAQPRPGADLSVVGSRGGRAGRIISRTRFWSRGSSNSAFGQAPYFFVGQHLDVALLVILKSHTPQRVGSDEHEHSRARSNPSGNVDTVIACLKQPGAYDAMLIDTGSDGSTFVAGVEAKSEFEALISFADAVLSRLEAESTAAFTSTDCHMDRDVQFRVPEGCTLTIRHSKLVQMLS